MRRENGNSPLAADHEASAAVEAVQRPSDSPCFGVERGTKGANDVLPPAAGTIKPGAVGAAGAPAAPASAASCPLRARTSVRSAFLKVTSRGWIAFTTQPEWASP